MVSAAVHLTFCILPRTSRITSGTLPTVFLTELTIVLEGLLRTKFEPIFIPIPRVSLISFNASMLVSANSLGISFEYLPSFLFLDSLSGLRFILICL